MVLKNLKKSSASLVIKKCKSKQHLDSKSFQYKWLRWKAQGTADAGKDVGRKGILLHCWWGCKLVKALWKSVWQFLKKLDIRPEDPTYLLGIYPEDPPTYNKDTCSTIFIAASFIIIISWKEPRCLSTKEWIQNLWCTYTMKYYSAIKNNEFMKVLGKLMELESVILREVTQSQKNTCGMHLLISGY